MDMDTILFLVVWTVGAIAASMYAKAKGRDGLPWGLLALVLSPVLALLLLPVSPAQAGRGLRACPFSHELVKSTALLCKHCRSPLPSNVAPSSATCRCGNPVRQPDIFCEACGAKLR
jgi:hypothetical protein